MAPSLRAARWPGPVRRMARASYERWLTGHRLTGVFVIVAVVHATIVDPVLHHSVLLRVAFLVVGTVWEEVAQTALASVDGRARLSWRWEAHAGAGRTADRPS